LLNEDVAEKARIHDRGYLRRGSTYAIVAEAREMIALMGCYPHLWLLMSNIFCDEREKYLTSSYTASIDSQVSSRDVHRFRLSYVKTDSTRVYS
jgi:hypothetical protein